MTDTSVKHISLMRNCGFAQCAIHELASKFGKRQQLTAEFQDVFKDCPSYGLPPSYFDDDARQVSPFNRHCDKIIASWNKKWHPPESRQKYESTFSIANWKALSVQVRQKHTLACCQECCSNHQDLQLSFPLKPCYEDTPLVSVNVQKLEKLGKKDE